MWNPGSKVIILRNQENTEADIAAFTFISLSCVLRAKVELIDIQFMLWVMTTFKAFGFTASWKCLTFSVLWGKLQSRSFYFEFFSSKPVKKVFWSISLQIYTVSWLSAG